MSNSLLSSSDFSSRTATPARVWMMRSTFTLAIATLFLMALGSATRVMNAGLSCPDWPLCYGEFVPSDQMNLEVFLEWFHRLVATTMGLSTIALCAASWWLRKSLPSWTPWATSFALLLVVFQGILGGLTVTELLRFDIVTAHLGTGLLFFGTLLAIATALMPYQGTGTAGKLRWVGATAAGLVYLQCILGGLVASRWALHQCFGTSQLCVVMNSHIAGIVPPSIAVLTLVIWAWRTPALPLGLRRLANFAGLLLLLQLTLGVATFRLHLQVEPLTVAHQATGAALLGSLIVFAVMAWRDSMIGQSVNDGAIATDESATLV
jgi:heme a synthase